MAGSIRASYTTRLLNRTSFEISLKTGNAGVWSRTGTIPADGDYEVISTANETYKQYWCAVQPNDDDEKVILSSDDCIEYKEIEIRPTAYDKTRLYWNGTVSRRTPPPAGTAPPPATNTGFIARLLRRLTGH